MNTLLKMFAWMPDMSEKRMLRQDMAWCRIFDLAEKKRRQLNCMDFVLNDGLSRLHIRGSTDSEKFMSDTKNRLRIQCLAVLGSYDDNDE